MELGYFSMPSHPPERGLKAGHDWDLQTLRWLDELGFSEAWIGEHHTAPWEPHPAPDLLIAQALLQTKRLKIGPGGFLLPYHHPAELANRVAMLDHLSEGRLLFGVAASGLPSDWAMFDVDGMSGAHREMTREALDIIGDITRAPKIDITGLCLGGALTAMLAAYLAEKGDDRIGSVTLLNTLLDYSEPGVLGTFTDEKTVARLEQKMAAGGVLEGGQMAGTFDILRANDLIFNYVVSNWLMGQDPPAFDILAWNGDNTRMPAAMHSFYLRSLYMRNELARGELELAGQKLSLSAVTNDTYVVGAINDHIVPWHASYKTGGLVGGTVRYVLSSGGHIAGIVNPPGPKAWYEAAEYTGADAETWRRENSKHKGSWWEDWTAWSDARAGALVKPPPMGSKQNRAIADAPGDYVFG